MNDGKVLSVTGKQKLQEDLQNNVIDVTEDENLSEESYKDYDNFTDDDYPETQESIPSTIGTKARHLCLQTMPRLNDQDSWNKEIKNTSMVKKGAGTMHLRMRSMEYYMRVGTKKKSKHLGITFKEVEHIIQQELKKKIGIRVNFVKQGKGNSNTGNTAKRFFENSKIVSEALGIPRDIIEDNSTKTRKSPEKYKKTAHIAFDRLVQNCIEHSDITPSIHILLVHGHTFLKYAQDFDIPLGRLSESAIEMRNKDHRRARLMFARKSSRKLFKRLNYN